MKVGAYMSEVFQSLEHTSNSFLQRNLDRCEAHTISLCLALSFYDLFLLVKMSPRVFKAVRV